MKAYDFEYDGLKLSNFGYMLCNFGMSGLQTISAGSQITFNTINVMHGANHSLTSTEYKDCLKTTLQICKKNCHAESYEISADEIRLFSRWLNRKGFHKFKILNAEYQDFYFEASFNISKLEFNGMVCGLELEITTNRPFALQEEKVVNLISAEANSIHEIQNFSDVEGFIYPKTEIIVSEDGDLEIYNQTENRLTRILNCSKGEYITLDYPIIETSNENHKIQNDFNWNYLRLTRTFRNKINIIRVSLPCIIQMRYSPEIKLGF